MTEEVDIKRAIKEALDDKKIEDIGTQLTNLATQVTKGFAEVHTRQDATNGKVLKNTNDIAAFKSKELYEKILWLLITSLVGLVTFFLSKN